MKKILLTAVLTLIVVNSASSQVGIGTETPDASAALEVRSTTKGFLPPRMTEDERNNISSPAQGLVIYCSNCGTNGEAQVYNGTEWTNMTGGAVAPVPPPKVGDYRDGGVVFYIFQSGDTGYVAGETHGLICAVSDQSIAAEWGCQGLSISGANGTEIGTGAFNTTYIVAGCTKPNTAADICYNLSLNGFNDWFLPSPNELNEMFLNKDDIDATAKVNEGGSFDSDLYWSSKEFFGGSQAHVKDFGNGDNSVSDKSVEHRVRAIRAF